MKYMISAESWVRPKKKYQGTKNEKCNHKNFQREKVNRIQNIHRKFQYIQEKERERTKNDDNMGIIDTMAKNEKEEFW